MYSVLRVPVMLLRGERFSPLAQLMTCCHAANGSAVYGAYNFGQVINNNAGLNVNGQAMNFYWQQTPQVPFSSEPVYWERTRHPL